MKRFLITFMIISQMSCNSISKNKIAIENFLKREAEQDNTPSIQYFLFNKDSIIYQFQNGYADIKNRKLVDKNISYNAYSVTKTFTALAIQQLAEKNLVDIDEPVKEYLPEFPYSKEITIRQLLSHSSGIPNPIPLDWIHLTSEHKSFISNDFFEEIIRRNSKVKFRPNEKFAYSNLGYIFLGQLIEKISKLSYEEYINKMIIRKINLKPGELGFIIENQDCHATGYQKKLSLINIMLGFFVDKSKYMGKPEGSWKPFQKFYVNGNAYGGIIGTPNGFVKYVQELLKHNSILISDDFKSLLFKENQTNKGSATRMCLSWFKGSLKGNTYFAHAGGGGGYYCEIRIYPDIGIGSVIMLNRTGISDERYLDKLDRYLIDEKVPVGNNGYTRSAF